MVKSLEIKSKCKKSKTKSKTLIKKQSKKYTYNKKLIALASLASLAAMIAAGFEINKRVKSSKEKMNVKSDIETKQEKSKIQKELRDVETELFNTSNKAKRDILNKKILELTKKFFN